MPFKRNVLLAAVTAAVASPAFATPTRLVLALTGRTTESITYSGTVHDRDASKSVAAIDLLIHVPKACRGKAYELTLTHAVGDATRIETTAHLEIAEDGDQWVALEWPVQVAPIGTWTVRINSPAPRPTATCLYLLTAADNDGDETAETATPTTVIVEREAGGYSGTTYVQPLATPVVLYPTKVVRSYRGPRYWRYHHGVRPAKRIVNSRPAVRRGVVKTARRAARPVRSRARASRRRR